MVSASSVARLAQVGVEVDEPGRHDAARRVEHVPGRLQVGADVGDLPVAHQHVGDALAGRVDDTTAL